MLAKEYAKAIYETLETKENFKNDFECLISGLRDNLEYIKLMDSKSLTKSQKKELVEKITSGDLTNLLYVLIDNNRFNLIFDIYSEYCNLIDEINNVMRLELVSSAKLDDSLIENIKQHFTKLYSKEIVINSSVDNELVSGIKITFAGKLLDNSIVNEMIKMKHELTKEVH